MGITALIFYLYFQSLRAHGKSFRINSSRALSTLLCADWLPQVNGPPRVLPSKSVNQSMLLQCQHRGNADNSNRKVYLKPFPYALSMDKNSAWCCIIINIFGNTYLYGIIRATQECDPTLVAAYTVKRRTFVGRFSFYR